LGDQLVVAPTALQPDPRSRRQQRRARKEAARRRRRVALIISGLVVVVVGTALVVPPLFGKRSDVPVQTSPTVRTQQTLTIVVASDPGSVLDGALLASDPEQDDGSVVLVPSRLLVEGPVPEDIPFSSTTRLNDPAAPGFALAQTLDVLVDGTWRLTPEGLSALVDSVGGVVIDVDSEVVVTRPNGNRQVLVGAGRSTLDGAQATAYATAIPQGGNDQVRLAHFNDVLQALLAKLPASADQVQALLDGLNRESLSTKGNAWLAGFLVSLAGAAAQDNVLAQTIPVQTLGAGGAVTVYQLDEAASEELLSRSFADSRPPGGTDRPRVLVQNGVGRPGLELAAAQQLTDAGFAFANGGNANHFGYDTSVVIVPDDSSASLELGDSVAKALGLPASAVEVAGEGQTIADVIVILGANYQR
jgi:hypothetical protein